MKSIRNISVCTVFFTLFFIITSCEKRSYSSFIHNDTKQGVSVEYGFGACVEDVSIVRLEAGQIVEIPDIDRWNIVCHTHNDSVVFLFDDGTRVVHRYEIEIDSAGFAQETFVPEMNNIFSNSLDQNPSWTSVNTSGNKFQYDYHIRF